MGFNGAGKTSLLRVLAGVTESRRAARCARASASRSATTPRSTRASTPGRTLLDHVRASSTGLEETELRGLLGMFGLTGDKVFQEAGTLSGGEKTKLALAQLVGGRHNVLLLDEPTNNLDPGSREAIAARAGRLAGHASCSSATTPSSCATSSPTGPC